MEPKDLKSLLADVPPMEGPPPAFIVEPFLHCELVRGACLFALTRHGLFESFVVNRDTAFAGNVGGQINRKTERVVQAECGFTVEYFDFLTECGFQNLHTVFQRFGEALFFLQQYGSDAFFGGGQFRGG